jgi:hypothetical protein
MSLSILFEYSKSYSNYSKIRKAIRIIRKFELLEYSNIRIYLHIRILHGQLLEYSNNSNTIPSLNLDSNTHE